MQLHILLVMEETDGNGVGRLMEATGAPPMVNNCFSLLRYTNQAIPLHTPTNHELLLLRHIIMIEKVVI